MTNIGNPAISDGYKKGRITFDLKYANFKRIKETLPLKFNEDFSGYLFTDASTFCIDGNYSPEYVFINCGIRISGLKDSVDEHPAILFTAGEIEIFRPDGSFAYQIRADNYDMSHAGIDTISDLIFFRTSRMDYKKRIEGI